VTQKVCLDREGARCNMLYLRPPRLRLAVNTYIILTHIYLPLTHVTKL